MEQYFLMNKDRIIAEIEMDDSFGSEDFVIRKTDGSYLPYGMEDINTWIENRQAAKHRKKIAELMRTCGCYTKTGFISMTRCASLTDTFWMKKADDPLEWKKISLYTNYFDETIARISFDGAGLYGMKFTPTTPELSTGGSFAKCWVRENDGGIYLYKRGSEGFSNAGMEPFSESFASQMLDRIGIRHVDYSVIMYHGKLASRCRLFTNEKYGFVSFAAYTGKRTSTIEKLRIYEKLGFENEFREMVVADAVMLNIDRHEGNYGFIVDNDTGEVISPAPLFDHNLSFLPYAVEDDDLNRLISEQGPRIGDDFIKVAESMLTPEIKGKLKKLKHFVIDPSDLEVCPDWRIQQANNLVNMQLNRLIGKARTKKVGSR